MGVNRSVVAKLLNQANKSRVHKEAWYSFFTFSTQVTFKFVNNGRVATDGLAMGSPLILY